MWWAWTAKLPELIIHNHLKVGCLVKVIPNWEQQPELIQLA
ncbi:hypothetical protein [Acinetobacter johnsonii]|nr:hypothetical protein [Acinetobacter johnsonii]